MSQNLKIVDFFISKFYKNSSDGMRELSSSTFSFTLNAGEKQDFKQFVRRMRFINSSAKFTVYKPVTHDDTNFYTQFEMKIPSHDSEFITALGKTKFVIKDGLLQTIDINYHKTQQEYDEFQSLMNESPVAFV